MKKLWHGTVLSGLVVMAFVLSGSPVQKVSAFAGGAGTSASPYQISTCAELLKIDDTVANLSKAYEFSNNVDCSSDTVVPLANGSTYFSGVLNGNNFSLAGLNITCTTGWGCALFLAVSGTPEIKNLTVVSPSINSTGHSTNVLTAALVAYSGSTSNPTFSNITISGGLIDAGVQKTSGSAAAGSIAGSIYRGTVTDSTSSATVRGGRYVGGLVGLLGDQNTTCTAGSPLLSGSSYSGNVSGSSYVGGLVGEFGPNRGKDICEIRNSFNSGTVTGTVGGTATTCSIIGGIVGQLWEATVEDSYNTGEIDGATNTCDDIGGVVGWARGNALSNSAFESPTLQRLYSTGSVSGRSRIGGIVGTCDRGELLVSHSTGAITSTGSYAGGLAGWSSCLTSDSYSRSTVSGSSYAGGLIGGISYYGVSRSYSTSASRGLVAFISHSPSASCTGAFWDKTLGSATSLCGASGKTTTEMKTKSTFESASWDFTPETGVWLISGSLNDGYPYLANLGGQALAAPTVVLSSVSPTSTTRNIQFRLTATSGEIDCSTLSAVEGMDFDLVNIVSLTVNQQSATVCSISAVSTISADGATGISSLAEAASFSVAYTGSYAQVNIHSGNPASIAVTIPAAAPVVVATTTTEPATTQAPTNTQAPSNTQAPLAPQSQIAAAPATTTTVAQRAQVGVVAAQVTTTTVAPTSTSSTTTTLPEADVPSVADRGGALLIDGKRVEAVVTRDNNQLIITAGAIRARISAVKREGGRAPLDSEGRLRMNIGDSIEIEIFGFASESEVEVRMYSDPVLLGRTGVGANGTLLASYEVPDSVDNGQHTVALFGQSSLGEELTFALAVSIGDESSGPSFLALLVAIPLGAAVVVGLVLPAVLRRRRKEEE
jgi:hypothetical protein